MDASEVILLLGAGLLAGAWNALAGGATVFTFPVLIHVGLAPVVANATNFLAVAPGNLVAVWPYLPELNRLGRALSPVLVIAAIGAVAGSLLLVVSEPFFFELLTPFLLLLATTLFLLDAKLRTWTLCLVGDNRRKAVTYLALFAVSIYGGYFGAGVGILFLALGQLLGFNDFHTANAVKNAAVTCLMLLSIALFGVTGLIAWPQAIIMALGSAVGGYWGARFTKKVNHKALRATVILLGFSISGAYFYKRFV